MDLSNTLRFKYPGAEYMVYGEEYDGLVWLDENIPKPTLEKVREAHHEYEQYKAKNKYIELRAAAIPSPAEQLNIIHAEGIEGWHKKIAEIKKKYPAPFKELESTIEDPMAKIQAQLNQLDERESVHANKLQSDISALEKAIIDSRDAMMAIKGFMMTIPEIKKQLDEVKEQLNKGDKDAANNRSSS